MYRKLSTLFQSVQRLEVILCLPISDQFRAEKREEDVSRRFAERVLEFVDDFSVRVGRQSFEASHRPRGLSTQALKPVTLVRLG